MLDFGAFVFIRAHNWDGKERRLSLGKQQGGLRAKALRFFEN